MTRSNGPLQKHYDKLTPRERLAMIFAAIARDDETERQILIDSAPRLRYIMPDYHGEADAFNYVCLLHIAKQLDNAFLQATLAHFDAKSRSQGERIYRACCIAAYVYCVRADAWRAFCEGLGIDADAALKHLPGADSLTMAESIARSIAFTLEEAQAEMERMEPLELRGELITAESAAAEMRATFEHWTRRALDALPLLERLGRGKKF